MYDCQGLRNGFWLRKQTVNGFFENENFELILCSEFQNFGEANASPVPMPMMIVNVLPYLQNPFFCKHSKLKTIHIHEIFFTCVTMWSQ